MSIAARLKFLRAGNHKTQSEVAAALGVSLRAYQNYERDDRPLPINLAIALHASGVSLEWLLFGRGDMKREACATELNTAIDECLEALQAGRELKCVALLSTGRITITAAPTPAPAPKDEGPHA